MLLGMATGQADAVRDDVGELLLYTPVVHPEEFDVAIAYLVRRLEENASSENFMSAVVRPRRRRRTLFERESQRFLALARRRSTRPVPEPHRTQNRLHRAHRRVARRTAFDATPPTPTRRTAAQPRVGRGSSLAPVRRTRSWALDDRPTASRDPRGRPASQTPSSSDDRAPRGAGLGSLAAPRCARWDPAPGRRAPLARPPRRPHRRSWPPRPARRSPRPTSRSARPSTSRTTTPSRARELDAVDGADVRAGRADRRHAAVELPGRDPGRRRARRARGRQRRHPQAGAAGPPLRRRHGRGALGGRRARATLLALVDDRRGAARPGAHRAPRRRPRHPHRRRGRRRSCSARGGPTCRCSPRPAARTPSSSRPAPTSTSPSPTSSRARSATPARSARRRRLAILVGSVGDVRAVPPPAASTPSSSLRVGWPARPASHDGPAHRAAARQAAAAR